MLKFLLLLVPQCLISSFPAALILAKTRSHFTGSVTLPVFFGTGGGSTNKPSETGRNVSRKRIIGSQLRLKVQPLLRSSVAGHTNVMAGILAATFHHAVT